MRAYPLLGQVGGDWALEFESFLGPVKWHRADRRVPFGAEKFSYRTANAPPPPITLTHSLSPSTPFILPLQLGPLASPHPTPHLPPTPPHLELIRNQQQSVRCIKGRSGSTINM
jgi:hypothetical protein